MNLGSVLEQISLVARNYGDSLVFEKVLLDWFDFLGGKPGEVVIVDSGSNRETQEVYWDLFQRGLIDKLQVIRQEHEEHNFDRGYIQIHTAAAIATKPYLLVFNIDTLPYRQGHEGWLEESIGYLDRDDVFAVGGSHNLPAKFREAWDGWYFSRKCSLNFALLKQTTYLAAMYEFAGDYIASGFSGKNPAAATNQSRYLLEVALERYMENHQVSCLCKIEDPNWTVFHTNVHEERLQAVREQYQARQTIEPYMNLGNSYDPPNPYENLRYYGQILERPRLVRRMRNAFSKSQVGQYWRQFKQQLLRA
jgi:Glycosyl transferase family 2